MGIIEGFINLNIHRNSQTLHPNENNVGFVQERVLFGFERVQRNENSILFGLWGILGRKTNTYN